MGWHGNDGDPHSSGSDDDEWETASETSDIDAQEDLATQLNPLEDVIMRSLAALNTANNEESSIIGMNQRTAEFMNALGEQFVSDRTSQGQSESTENSANNQGEPESTENSANNREQSESNENSANNQSVCGSSRDTGENDVSRNEESVCDELAPCDIGKY